MSPLKLSIDKQSYLYFSSFSSSSIASNTSFAANFPLAKLDKQGPI
jgi:hypothetical protein